MIATRQRVEKYRSVGGAADLVRVEVLVPPSARKEILATASRLRTQHRSNKELRSLYDNAFRFYGTRILDNIDLDRLPDRRSRAAVVAAAMPVPLPWVGGCLIVWVQWQAKTALTQIQSDARTVSSSRWRR